MKKMAEYNKIQVHGGTFHADDVMCVLLAQYKRILEKLNINKIL